MGIVWEAYHKGVTLLGVPGITLDFINQQLCLEMLVDSEMDSPVYRGVPFISCHLLAAMSGEK